MSRLSIIVVLVVILFSCTKNSETTVSKKVVYKLSNPTFKLLDPSQSGVQFENPIVEDSKFNHLYWQSIYMGGGVGLVDINNDGLLDIYFCGNKVKDKLYLNKGNLKFEDISEMAGINRDLLWSNGVSFADVNGDGYQDIYVCNTHWTRNPAKRTNRLYINQKDNTFREMAS